MLNIRFGLDKTTISRIKSVFHSGFEPEWLDDPFVKEMILDVDKTKVISPYCLQSPVLGQISPDYLSGGVKALILMYKTDLPINASKCGDNCCKWILDISKKKDLTIHLEHLMKFREDFTFTFINTGEVLNTYKEYLIAMGNVMEGFDYERGYTYSY